MRVDVAKSIALVRVQVPSVLEPGPWGGRLWVLPSEPCLEKKGIPCFLGSSSLRVRHKIHLLAAGSAWFENALQIRAALLLAQDLEVPNRVEIKSGRLIVTSACCRQVTCGGAAIAWAFVLPCLCSLWLLSACMREGGSFNGTVAP